ncbi:AraC family transcriptional regulator [Luteolibacter sp. SL250]|uniref:helix-turn-helix transcriptional regulator n=1 Tax=Luteolibacter sp. SL250 TaxID=2995170 RepID=UPI002272221A|nr:AraC family transcriptional regulator [Luteolibacter sp. SL250]WAC18142.1 AraC family transcriptional regulator [Luteolibacter sp. SL250]
MKLPAHAQILHGLLARDGATVIGIDTDSGQPLDWGGMLLPGYAHLILNLDGYGVVLGDNIRLSIFPGMTAICRIPTAGGIYASRLPGSGRHRCVVLTVSDRWLADKFGGLLASLHPLFGDADAVPEQIGLTRSMSLAEKDLCEAMLAPPVTRPLRPMWFRAKLVECFSLFGGVEHPSTTRKQDSISLRVDKAVLWLREHFDEELDLKELSVHVGCAPHYLSRLFRSHTGKTLTQKLRQIRIDHAADLLQNGTHNVTEAALEVGYSSISHFTKAFLLEKGILPSLYRHN